MDEEEAQAGDGGSIPDLGGPVRSRPELRCWSQTQICTFLSQWGLAEGSSQWSVWNCVQLGVSGRQEPARWV